MLNFFIAQNVDNWPFLGCFWLFVENLFTLQVLTAGAMVLNVP